MIKADKWIERQCTRPTHYYFDNSGKRHLAAMDQYGDLTELTDPELADEARSNVGELSKEEREAWRPMIEPFFAEQQRTRTVKDLMQDHPLEIPAISFGNSSYGYDVRVADEFKIFTNVHGGRVDPKNFDDTNYVKKTGSELVIPPNGFALARTVEYFKIPRNTLVVCLGKSTYARCFTGDTCVALVDGTNPTFVELVERAEKGERLWGYSVDDAGGIVVAEFIAPRKVGHEAVLQVELDDGSKISCTPDHKFMLRDGSFVEAKDLTPDTSLMPLYRGEYRGYESVYQPTAGRMVSTHWLSDLWNIRTGAYVPPQDTERHHFDLNRRNNNPSNIVRLSEADHHALHNDGRWSTEESRVAHGEKISEAIQALCEDAEWYSNYCAQQTGRANRFWNDPEYAEQRAELLAGRQNVSDETRQKHSDSTRQRYLSQESREAHGELMKEAWLGGDQRRKNQAEVARKINLREEITAAVVEVALAVAGTIRGAARQLGCDRSVFRRFPEVLSNFFGTKVATNHKVKSVTILEGTQDVYCLTAPEFGNFALESGVFVKNCGIIVNVTPLEPEWEGHVTLEFSNTTSLPAVVYANEGVAQFLFFESDEDCDISYKDRDGKYQGQTGVTDPRI